MSTTHSRAPDLRFRVNGVVFDVQFLLSSVECLVSIFCFIFLDYFQFRFLFHFLFPVFILHFTFSCTAFSVGCRHLGLLERGEPRGRQQVHAVFG